MNLANTVRLLLLASLWGGSFLLIRIAAPELGPVPAAFGRVLLAMLGLLALLFAMRTPLRFQGKFGATLALGALNSGLPFFLYALAAQSLPAGYSAILNAMTPLMGVILGVAAFGERLTVTKFMGVLVGLTGVVVLTRAGPLAINATTLWGVAACLGATVCYALSSFLTQRWISRRGGLDSGLVAFGSQIGAVSLLLPFTAWQAVDKWQAWMHVGSHVWIALLILGLLCTSVAYILFFRLIADIGPLKTITVTFLIPPFGVFWGWLLLHEPVTLAHLAGGGLIAIALALILRPAKAAG